MTQTSSTRAHDYLQKAVRLRPVNPKLSFFFEKKRSSPRNETTSKKMASNATPPPSSGKKSYTCSICQCKHQSARGQHCKQLKNTLPIFTTYVQKIDRSRETSFARNTDESLATVFAIRRIMGFMHSNVEAFQAWSEANPTLEIGLESSAVSNAKNVAAGAITSATLQADERGDEDDEEALSPEAILMQLASGKSVTRVPQPQPQPQQQQSSSDKGPAPPCLSYEFLAKAPKINSLVLKRS